MLRYILDILEEEVSPTEISNAIQNKTQVLINYEDEERHAPGRRIIEPYVYGTLPNGNQVIRGFQYSGDTYRGVPKWKLFRVDRIKSWTETENKFNQPPRMRGWSNIDYNTEGDKQMSNIYCKVSFTDDELSSDSLSVARNRTRQISQSNPINIFKDKENLEAERKNAEFQRMLKRNLELTQKEKDRRGFSLSNKRATFDGPMPTMDDDDDEFKKSLSDNMSSMDGDEPKQPVSEPSPQQSAQKTEDEIFRDMIKRNLEITRREKEKRGFDINNTNR